MTRIPHRHHHKGARGKACRPCAQRIESGLKVLTHPVAHLSAVQLYCQRFQRRQRLGQRRFGRDEHILREHRCDTSQLRFNETVEIRRQDQVRGDKAQRFEVGAAAQPDIRTVRGQRHRRTAQELTFLSYGNQRQVERGSGFRHRPVNRGEARSPPTARTARARCHKSAGSCGNDRAAREGEALYHFLDSVAEIVRPSP